jgi:predicted nuclease with TOPRIM domain
MTEYAEMAEILFDVKEKLDDNEYLALSNLLLKANNKQRDYERMHGEARRLINLKVMLEAKVKAMREELDRLNTQLRSASTNAGHVVCECGCTLKASSMRNHLTSLKHRRYLTANARGNAMAQSI